MSRELGVQEGGECLGLVGRIRWPRISARPSVALFVLASVVGLAQGLLLRLLSASRGVPVHGPVVLFQLTGALGAFASMPVAQLTALNAPSPMPPTRSPFEDTVYRATLRWTRFLAAHLVGYLAFSACHIAVIRGLRWMLLELSIVAVPDGPLGPRILWEMQNDMIVYVCAAAILTMMRAFHERDETKVRSSALEARLAEARLDALAARVDPHFFYNALNTIVTDDGIGFSEGAPPLGKGLGRLEETLRLLYGAVGSLERGSRAGGGARVLWSVPYAAS